VGVGRADARGFPETGVDAPASFDPGQQLAAWGRLLSFDAGFARMAGPFSCPWGPGGLATTLCTPACSPGVRVSVVMLIGRLQVQNPREGLEFARSSGTSGSHSGEKLVAPRPNLPLVPDEAWREAPGWSGRTISLRPRSPGGLAASTQLCSIVGPPMFRRLLVDPVLLLPVQPLPPGTLRVGPARYSGQDCGP
jgi:hypothetical protein